MALEKHDVEVMHVKVLSVATPGSQQRVAWSTPTPRTMAKGALNRVGCGALVVAGCFRHAVMTWSIGTLIPRDMLSRGVSDIVKVKGAS